MSVSEKRKAQMAAYRERNLEELRAADRARYAEGADAAKASAKARYDALTPEEKKARQEAGYSTDEQRAAKRARNRAAQAAVRRAVIDAYGGACSCCGTTFTPHLTVDHVDGGGGVERKTITSHSLLRRLRREGFPPGFQILCWNCNWTKHTHGRCPCSDEGGE